MRRSSRRFALAISAFALGLAALAYTHPSWAFAHVETHAWVSIHSTRPLAPASAPLLASVRQKLARIPFAHESAAYDIFVCEDDWRWSAFTLFDSRSAAVARAPLSRDVIVRAADFTQNRYRQASGADAPADRPLDYLLAHELTHLAVTDHLGVRRALALPSWVREGYADYIARGPSFDHAAALRAEREHAGRYATHALLVAQVLERDGCSVETLLTNPPARAEVEARARAQ